MPSSLTIVPFLPAAIADGAPQPDVPARHRVTLDQTHQTTVYVGIPLISPDGFASIERLHRVSEDLDAPASAGPGTVRDTIMTALIDRFETASQTSSSGLGLGAFFREHGDRLEGTLVPLVPGTVRYVDDGDNRYSVGLAELSRLGLAPPTAAPTPSNVSSREEVAALAAALTSSTVEGVPALAAALEAACAVWVLTER